MKTEQSFSKGMDKLPPLSQKNQKTLDKLAQMVDSTKDELTKNPINKNALSPKQLLVISMFAAVNSYTEAIFVLCKQHRPDAAIVILRSITEAWINSLYILGSPNDKLLYLFAIEDSYYRQSLVNLVRNLHKKYPNLKSKLITTKKLDEMAQIPKKELNDYKLKLGISFKNKKEFDKIWGNLLGRAINVDTRLKKRQKGKGGNVENAYTMVYKYLSEYTHLSMRGLQHFWVKKKQGEFLILDKNPDKIDLVLDSTFTFYLYFASRLKQYKLIKRSLAPYKKFFNSSLKIHP